MTEAMPFLQKAILLSYDPLPFALGAFLRAALRGTGPRQSPASSRPLRLQGPPPAAATGPGPTVFPIPSACATPSFHGSNYI